MKLFDVRQGADIRVRGRSRNTSNTLNQLFGRGQVTSAAAMFSLGPQEQTIIPFIYFHEEKLPREQLIEFFKNDL